MTEKKSLGVANSPERKLSHVSVNVGIRIENVWFIIKTVPLVCKF